MGATLTVAWREYASFFRSSIGWLVIALYLFLSGLWFAYDSITPGQPASMRALFSVSQWLLLIVAPAISMRLLSEELRSGTIEPLMTAPISDWHIVIGKYLAALAFLITMLLPTLIHVGVIELLASPDYGPILAGYLGLVFVGACYLAVGLFFSSLTRNQIVAFLSTLFFFMLLVFISSPNVAALVDEPFRSLLFGLSINLRIADFAKGVFDTSHAAFFLAFVVLFVVLSVVGVESRRWR
ncbi:MAG: ABC transporter permease subunit [Phycisphaerales bacterium]